MSNLRKGIWFPISLTVIVILIALWFPFKYGSDFLLNRALLKAGVSENGQIVKKGILVNGKLVWTQQTKPSDDHVFIVKLLNHGKEDLCQFGVSRRLYNNSPLGIKIPVTFLPENPQLCKLSFSLPGSQSILSKGLLLSAGMMLFAFGTLFYIYHSHKQPGPGSSSHLTTTIKSEDAPNCPQCGIKMAEGYLPMGFGIHWRNINQPVAMTTIFSGLSGTVSLLKRPKFHGYHCEKCRIIIFKYGAEDKKRLMKQ
jgi:hypothetical protein